MNQENIIGLLNRLLRSIHGTLFLVLKAFKEKEGVWKEGTMSMRLKLQ